jgi:hypothetical protein
MWHVSSRPINLQEKKDEWTLEYSRVRFAVHLGVAKVHHKVTIAHRLGPAN